MAQAISHLGWLNPGEAKWSFKIVPVCREGWPVDTVPTNGC